MNTGRTNDTYILWGAPASLYNGKARSYLIKKRIPWRLALWLPKTSPGVTGLDTGGTRLQLPVTQDQISGRHTFSYRTDGD
jgi:hypothetical protein